METQCIKIVCPTFQTNDFCRIRLLQTKKRTHFDKLCVSKQEIPQLKIEWREIGPVWQNFSILSIYIFATCADEPFFFWIIFIHVADKCPRGIKYWIECQKEINIPSLDTRLLSGGRYMLFSLYRGVVALHRNDNDSCHEFRINIGLQMIHVEKV